MNARSICCSLALLATVGCAATQSSELSTPMQLAMAQAALQAEQSDQSVVGAPEWTELALVDASFIAPPTPEPVELPPVEVLFDVDTSASDAAKEPAVAPPIAEPVAPPPPVVAPAPSPVSSIGSTMDGQLTAAIQSLTRSIDEQRVMGMVEYRLADKQRLIDALERDLTEVRSAQSPALASAPPPVTPRPQALAQTPTAEGAPAAAAATPTQTAEIAALNQSQADLVARLEAEKVGRAELATRLAALEAPPAAQQAPPEKATPNPEMRELQQRLDAQQKALTELQQGRAAASPSSRDPEMVALLEAQRAEIARLKQSKAKTTDGELRAVLARQQLEIDRLASNPAKEATSPPPPAGTDPEVKALLEQLIAAQQPTTDPETEALRTRLNELESRPDPGADLRALVKETEAERQRMSDLEARIATSDAERARLETELAAADEDRRVQLQAEQSSHSTRAAVLEGQLAELQTRTTEMESLYTTQYASVLAQLQPLVDSGVDVRVVAGKIRVDMASDVLFSSGSATLSRGGTDAVRQIGQALVPFKTLLVQVEGHTDNVPLKSFKYESNWDLAFARARSVMTVIIGAGVPDNRVSAASFGDTQPLTGNDTREGRSANRRIELVLQLAGER